MKRPRPVKCFFCKKQMYYHGDKRWVEEVRIRVTGPTEYPLVEVLYAHLKCWNKFKEKHEKEKIS